MLLAYKDSITHESALCFVCVQIIQQAQGNVVFSLNVVGCMLPWLGCMCPTQLFFVCYMSIQTMLAYWGSDICCGLVKSCLVYVDIMCVMVDW